jgi:predicted DCC family thiol-disulfide oxidoreductase YuxK
MPGTAGTHEGVPRAGHRQRSIRKGVVECQLSPAYAALVAGLLTVLYDADCGFCRLTARALMRLDWWRRLDLVPLQSFAAEPGPTRAELLEALHVRDAAGRWSRGGAAALRIAAAIPLLRPLAIAGRLPGMTRVAERAYRFVAGHRTAISRLLDLDRSALDLRPSPADEA